MTSIPKFDETRNIRDIKRLDDSEPRESMDKWGWLPQFPAYADENGVLLVGHRRMKLAKLKLRCAPVVETITFGKGSDADVERLRLTIASNIGTVTLSKQRSADRQAGLSARLQSEAHRRPGLCELLIVSGDLQFING